MTVSKVIALGLIGLMTVTASMSVVTPVWAGDTVLEPVKCLSNVRQIYRFYSFKQADGISVKNIGSDLYRVTLTKDGKKGVYEFDGCTRQSRKIS